MGIFLLPQKFTSASKSGLGFSTLEILLAMAIAILSLSAVLLVSFNNQSLALDSQTAAEAQNKAQSLLEQEQAAARFDFDLVYDIPQASDGSIYQKKVTVQTMDTVNEVKKVTATETWIGDHNRSQSSQLSTLVTNPGSDTNGDTCSSVLTQDWSNPVIKNPAHTIDISPNTLTGVAVNRGIAYIIGTHSGNKPDMYTVDVSDPTFPQALGNINTGSGLAAVAVSGHYAYAANLTTTAQLQVIDVSDPTFSGATTVISKKVTGAGGVGNSIFYYNNRVYLGLTANGAGPQFIIYDVTVPTNPTPVPGGTYTFGHDVNSIKVRGNYAYLVSPSSEPLIILDVNPNSPTFMQKVGSYASIAGETPDANGVGSNYGESLDLIGNTVYLGRSYGTKEYNLLDVTTPSSLSRTNSKDIGGGNGTTINGVVVRSGFAFMTASQQFQVWSLSDLSGIYGSLDLSGFNGSPSGGLACEGNLFYVGVIGPSGGSGHNVLQIVGPGAPNVYTLSNSGDITVGQGNSGFNTVTRTLISGNTSVTLVASGLPAGATPTFTNNPCTATCSSQLTITTSPATLVGSYPITVTGNGGVTTVFNLLVKSFDYTLAPSVGSMTITRAAAGGTNTVTVTMTPGAVPQSVTITPRTNDLPSGITVSPASRSCTPSATSPYQCTTAAFTYTASATASLGGPTTINIDGASPSHSTSFGLTVNAPAFNDSLAASGNITVTHGGAAVNEIITVTMTTPGAVAQAVTLSNSALPSGVSVVYSPASQACTPSASSPYQCTVTLSFTASAGAPPTVGQGPNITITGTSPGVANQTTTFKLKVN